MRLTNGFRLYVLVVAIPASICGCVTAPPAPAVTAATQAPLVDSPTPSVKQALYDELERWRGTRYRLGGTGRKGIDCSGLTYVVYRDVFGRQLPRTTEEQENVGSPVSRGSLEPGDLVFFKTGRSRRHVGIYLENSLFMHASASDGVRVSSLKNRYWHRRYWKARRIASI